MAGSHDLKLWEGRATIILPGRFPLICESAMYAPDAPRNLISYKNIMDSQTHISTTVDRDEEVLELRQRQSLLGRGFAALK